MIPDLLSLRDAVVGASDPDEFEGWTGPARQTLPVSIAGPRGDGAITLADRRLRHRRHDGVRVQQPDLGDDGGGVG